jgi:thioredoxin-like negative regulator of GroEL
MMKSAKQRPVSEADAQVGQAWSMHYHGQNDNALQLFTEIVQRWPDHIDANYGLGLTFRAAGMKAEAANAYQKTKSLVQAASAVDSDDNARLLMLSRIIDQQLAML